MFYDVYKELCAKSGKAVTRVAQDIGLAGKAATEWANGAEPRNSTKLKLAQYFGVDVSIFDEGLENKSVFADVFQRLCAESGKSVTEVANAIGIAPTTAYDWIKNGAEPRIGTKRKLADYFGVSIAVFIGNETPKITVPPAVPVSVVTNDELRVLSLLRSLTEQEKETIMTMLEALAQKHLTDKRTVG